MTSVKKLKLCAIVKFSQPTRDTPLASYENIKLTQNNKSAKRILVSAGASNAITTNMRYEKAEN
jgi:hypothetical protein